MMRLPGLVLILLISACKGHSSRQAPFAAVVTAVRDLPSLPSGSAICRNPAPGGGYFITTDDGAYIYRYTARDGRLDSIPVSGMPAGAHRIPKPQKTDYEASLITSFRGRPYLISFGSGSRSPTRDSVLILSIAGPPLQQTVHVRALYDRILSAGKMDKAALNIEAATVLGTEAILFNRGTNTGIRIDAAALAAYLLDAAAVPRVRLFRVGLPHIAGRYQPGISGACSSGAGIIFCASVEATTDWTKDGTVLGSYIGALARVGDSFMVSGFAPVRDHSGKPIADKLEGVELTGNRTEVLCVADNDDGSSRMLRIRLSGIR